MSRMAKVSAGASMFMGSVPIIEDQLAVSASYSRRDTPGYIDNILRGEDDVNDAVQKGGRLASSGSLRTISRCSSMR